MFPLPRRVLIGGPAVAARSMASHALQRGARVEALLGRYEDMPLVHRIDSGQPVDMAAVPRFDAALFGWTSYSHLRGSRSRVAALRAMADVTDGPVVASFYPRPAPTHVHGLRRFLNTLGKRSEGDAVQKRKSQPKCGRQD